MILNQKAGVRGVNDFPDGITPQSLAPEDQMTPPWRKLLPYQIFVNLHTSYFGKGFNRLLLKLLG